MQTLWQFIKHAANLGKLTFSKRFHVFLSKFLLTKSVISEIFYTAFD
jgi:hypothetical protein